MCREYGVCLSCLLLGDRLTLLEVVTELHGCLVSHAALNPSWATGEVCAKFHSLRQRLLPYGIEPLHLAELLSELGGHRRRYDHYEPGAKLKALSQQWVEKLDDPPLGDFRKLLDVSLPGKTAPSEPAMRQLLVGYCILMDVQGAAAAASTHESS